MLVRRLLSLIIAGGIYTGLEIPSFRLDAATLRSTPPPQHRRSVEPSSIYVYDGDTIIVDDQRMRLLGVDTPEISEPRCEAEKMLGYKARDRLRTLVETSDYIELVHNGSRDKYGRPLITLIIDGRDSGEVLIAEGLAVVWRPGAIAWQRRLQHWCGSTSR